MYFLSAHCLSILFPSLRSTEGRLPVRCMENCVKGFVFKGGGRGRGCLLRKQFLKADSWCVRGFSLWCWQLKFPECQRKDPTCGPDVQVTLAQDCPKLVSGIPPFSARTAVVSTCTVHLPSDLGLGGVILWVPVFDTLPRI